MKTSIMISQTTNQGTDAGALILKFKTRQFIVWEVENLPTYRN